MGWSDQPTEQVSALNPPRCEWASCTDRATAKAGRWSFCTPHLGLHTSLEQGLVDDLEDELRDAQTGVRVALERVVKARAALAEAYRAEGLKKRLPLWECGSHASYNRHLDRGEAPCLICEEGERIFQADAHLERKAARTLTT